MSRFFSIWLMLMYLSTNSLLASGNVESGSKLTNTCVACHSADGNSSVAIWPKIAGQHENYLYKQLLEFKKGESGNRYEPSMLGMVKDFSDQQLADLAAFYASKTTSAGKADASLVELGQKLYRRGDLARGITACSSCHGPKGLGNSLANYPKLAGQNNEYTAQQLKNYRSKIRSSDPQGMMRDIASMLTDADIEAVSSYISGLH